MAFMPPSPSCYLLEVGIAAERRNRYRLARQMPFHENLVLATPRRVFASLSLQRSEQFSADLVLAVIGHFSAFHVLTLTGMACA